MRGKVRERGWGGADRVPAPRRAAAIAQTHNGGLGGGRAVEKMPHLFEGGPRHRADSVPAAQRCR